MFKKIKIVDEGETSEIVKDIFNLSWSYIGTIVACILWIYLI